MASIYCCKECGANLNLHSSYLYPPDFYFEAGNKGRMSSTIIEHNSNLKIVAWLYKYICKYNLVQNFHVHQIFDWKQPKLNVSQPTTLMLLVPRFLAMGKCMLKSPNVAKQEIDNYLKWRPMVEEDHLSTAIKAVACKRAQSLSRIGGKKKS